MPLQEHTKCSACGETANKKCTACQTHVYCNKDCQRKDWWKHKTVCKGLKEEMILQRGAELAKALYLDFRENTFDNHVVNVKMKGSHELHIYDGPNEDRESYYVQFPNHLVDATTKNGVLCTLTCQEPLAFMETIIRQIFKDSQVEIFELEVKLHKPSFTTLSHIPHIPMPHSNWETYSHSVWGLKSLNSKRKWILDITGEQYGITQAFWVWEAYQSRYEAELKQAYDLGTHKDFTQRMAKIDGNPAMISGCGLELANEFQNGIDEWVKANKTSLSEVVKLPGEAFRAKRDHLLETMKNFMAQHMAKWDVSARWAACKEYERKSNTSMAQVRQLSQTFWEVKRMQRGDSKVWDQRV